MSITRRGILGRSALALATAPALLRRFAAAAPSDRIRIGLIGCGGIAQQDLTAFLIHPEVECPVICDIDDAQLAKTSERIATLRGRRPEAVKDFRRVIDRKDIEACLICTPDHWHALPMVYACQAGKDVYVEKPMASSIAEATAMREAARRHNRVVQVGTQWRSGAHYQEAAAFVQSGKLGKLRVVRAWAYLDWVGDSGNPADCDPPAGVDYDMWLGPAPRRPFNPNRFHLRFRWFWDYAGGLMTDWGVHMLNLAMWATGSPQPLSVSSSGAKYVLHDNTETPDTQSALYEFPDFMLIWEHQILGGIGIGARPTGISFGGSEGTLIVDQRGWEVIPEPKKKNVAAVQVNPAGGLAVVARAAGVKVSYPDFVRSEDEETLLRKALGQKLAGVVPDESRLAHVRNFLDCMKSRRQPVSNPGPAHLAATVAHLGNVALRSGTRVAWDAKEERVLDNPRAERFLARPYRKPWALPYYREAT
jgi:predicted dehydrogenase